MTDTMIEEVVRRLRKTFRGQGERGALPSFSHPPERLKRALPLYVGP
mgnify:CR=1 FL=1